MIKGALSEEEFQTPLGRSSFVLGEGRWIVRYRAVDIYGNYEDWRERLVLVDRNAPVVEARLSGDNGGNGWFVSPVEINLSATDPVLEDGTEGSGIAEIEYSLDNASTWHIYSGPFVVDQEGTSPLSFRARDMAGNTSEIALLNISIDLSGPEMSLFVEPDELWPPTQMIVPVQVTGQVKDEVSGLASLSVEVEDEYGEWEPTIDPLVLGGTTAYNLDLAIELIASRRGQDEDGRSYIIRVIASDVAGNSTEEEMTVTVPHDEREIEG